MEKGEYISKVDFVVFTFGAHCFQYSAIQDWMNAEIAIISARKSIHLSRTYRKKSSILYLFRFTPKWESRTTLGAPRSVRSISTYSLLSRNFIARINVCSSNSSGIPFPKCQNLFSWFSKKRRTRLLVLSNSSHPLVTFYHARTFRTIKNNSRPLGRQKGENTMDETRKAMLLDTFANVNRLTEAIEAEFRSVSNIEGRKAAAEILPQLLQAYRLKVDLLGELEGIL